MQKGDVFIGVSTYFGHYHAHYQNSAKPTKLMVYSTGRSAVHSRRRGGSVCTCWDWFHETHRRCGFCTVLLMMGMMMPETCWDTNKYVTFLHLVGYLFTFKTQCVVSVTPNLELALTLIFALLFDGYELDLIDSLQYFIIPMTAQDA
jgi:hypothetical protein